MYICRSGEQKTNALLHTCRTGEQTTILIGSAFSLGYMQIWGAETYPHKGNPFCFEYLQIWGSRKHPYREICFFIFAETYPYRKLRFFWIFADLGSKTPKLCFFWIFAYVRTETYPNRKLCFLWIFFRSREQKTILIGSSVSSGYMQILGAENQSSFSFAYLHNWRAEN